MCLSLSPNCPYQYKAATFHTLDKQKLHERAVTMGRVVASDIKNFMEHCVKYDRCRVPGDATGPGVDGALFCVQTATVTYVVPIYKWLYLAGMTVVVVFVVVSLRTRKMSGPVGKYIKNLFEFGRPWRGVEMSTVMSNQDRID